MAAHGFVSNESKLQAENDGLRKQLTNVIGAAQNVQGVLRRLWAQHESEQLQIQQLEARLSARPHREAWADEESVLGGVRPASVPVTATRSASVPAVRSASPECVGRVTSRAEVAISKKPVTVKTTGAPTAPTWEAQAWLADGSSTKLAELLLAPFQSFKSKPEYENANIDLELIRALAKEQDSKAAVLALLEHSNALPQIASFISEKMVQLVGAAAVSGHTLNAKFVEDYDASEMAFGQQNEFFKGLEGLIGPPNPDLVKAMRGEHCERTDSREPFTTSNYNIETSSCASMAKVS